VSIHQEIQFESEICADMAASGWLYTPPEGTTFSPDASGYNAEFAADIRFEILAAEPHALREMPSENNCS
jgi:type I restriction enzyme R subunit